MSSTFYNSQNLVGIGSVGIGTTSPISALHVQGSQYYTGDAVKSAAHLVPNQTNAPSIQNWINYNTSVAAQSWWIGPGNSNVNIFNIGSQSLGGGVYSSHNMIIFTPGTGSTIVAFYPETETYTTIQTSITPGDTSGGFAIPGNQIVCNPNYGSIWSINQTNLTSAYMGNIPSCQYSGCLTANNIIFAPQIAPSNIINFNYTTGTTSNVLAFPPSNNFGRVWTQSTTSPTNTNAWQGCAWSPQLGLFVAVAINGSNKAAWSTDGKIWTQSTTSPTNTNAWQGCAWSPQLGLFVAIASSGSVRAAWSTDGKVWSSTGVTSPDTGSSWQSCAWSPQLGLFVAIASSGSTTRGAWSTDGKVWSSAGVTSPDTGSSWQAVEWSPQLGLFVAVASNGTTTRAVWSTNGKTWNSITSMAFSGWYSCAWSPQLGLFVAVGNGGVNRAAYSTDGKTWTQSITGPPSGVSMSSCAWSPQLGIFVAVASSSGSGSNTRGLYSTDGKIWTPSVTSPDTTSAWQSCAWSPQLGIFVAVASSSGSGNSAAYSIGQARQQGIQLLPNGNVITPSPGTANVIQFDPVGLSSSNIFVGTDGFFSLSIVPNGNVIGTPNKSNIIVINPSLGISSNITTPFASFQGACLMGTGNVFFTASIPSANSCTFDPVSGNFSNVQSSNPSSFGSATLVPSGKVVLTPTYNGSNVGVYSSQTPVDQTFCASPYFNKC
jgi:hypothetical protein